MYAPLIAAAETERGHALSSASLGALSMGATGSADVQHLAAVFTATTGGEADGRDRARRATLRILARAWQLNPEAPTWLDAFVRGVAYGPAARLDPVLGTEEAAAVWRGVVLRHRSVGGWRRLWGALVTHARSSSVGVSRSDLHDWIVDQLPDGTVAGFLAQLPAVADSHGDPVPAEDAVSVASGRDVAGDVAVLLLGAQRLDSLTGRALVGFGGRRRTYLDPTWMRRLRDEYAHRSVRDLGCRLVDDMLAQARRRSLAKAEVHAGMITMPSRLRERDGIFFATAAESSANIGLRIPQLADIAVQIGLLAPRPDAPVTALGSTLLDLPT